MRILLLALMLFTIWAAPAAAQTPAASSQFVSVAFHDIVDDPRELSDDAITTDRLIAFFEWLRGNGWTAISLDDVARAARGGPPLPPRAVLITFDDGYRSLYTRVFPLLLAYRMPVVAALVGSWVDAPMDAQVQYDDKTVPRSKFISWAEAREMQASGLVEFGAHSYDLHRGVVANPQGNTMPAAVTRAYVPGRGYEDAAAHAQRIAADAQRVRTLLQRELGRAPRAWIWPYGRYAEAALDAVRTTGFEFALTLDAGPADARMPLAIPRSFPGADSTLGSLVSLLRLDRSLPAARRFLCLDPAALWTGDAAVADERLGHAIERVRTLGATAVVINATTVNADGTLGEAWFPTTQLPLRADLLSRLTWQMQTRAGVEVYVRLPSGAAASTLGSTQRVDSLFHDLGTFVPATGIFVDDVPALGAAAPAQRGFAGRPWETRMARDKADENALTPPARSALRAFRQVQRERPALQLSLLVDPIDAARQGALADVTLVRVSDAAGARKVSQQVSAAAALPGADSRRTGIWFAGTAPPSPATLSTGTRRFQRLGGNIIGWCPDSPLADQPSAVKVAPDVSASTFPVKF